jgi:hypothetical protein
MPLAPREIVLKPDLGRPTAGPKVREAPLLRRMPESREVFVYRTVEGFERLFRQELLVLVADVNPGFLEGVNEGGISADIGHRVNKNLSDLGIA